MTADLLPCPFCGGSAERIDFGPGSGDNEGGSCIACTKCQSSGPVEFGYKENFVSNWNRRALSHAAGQEVVACPGCGVKDDAFTCMCCGQFVKLHAPPTTSAEVGRNSDRYLWLKENAPDAHMWSDESIDAAMAASSGRQGD